MRIAMTITYTIALVLGIIMKDIPYVLMSINAWMWMMVATKKD